MFIKLIPLKMHKIFKNLSIQLYTLHMMFKICKNLQQKNCSIESRLSKIVDINEPINVDYNKKTCKCIEILALLINT